MALYPGGPGRTIYKPGSRVPPRTHTGSLRYQACTPRTMGNKGPLSVTVLGDRHSVVRQVIRDMVTQGHGVDLTVFTA